MIITRQKTMEEIGRSLEGYQRIFILGCGDCAATCKTGGQDDVRRMAQGLSSIGKEVTGEVVPDVTCVSAQVKSALAAFKKELNESQAILVLACGSGVQCVKDSLRVDKDVLPGCESLFAAMIDKNGLFQEACRTCGQCVLEFTDGVCPVSQCPKGLVNGPCGGQKKGKCEVDFQTECVWVKVYHRLKNKNQLGKMKRCLSARDHRKLLRSALSVPR